jgi:hypothetical protein
MGGVCCAINLYGGRPSLGTCQQCPSKVPAAAPTTAARPARESVAITPKSWPLFARTLAKLATPEDRGLGDVVQRQAAKLGGDTFKKLYRQLTGSDCGCRDRQAKLNQRFPLK